VFGDVVAAVEELAACGREFVDDDVGHGRELRLDRPLVPARAGAQVVDPRFDVLVEVRQVVAE